MGTSSSAGTSLEPQCPPGQSLQLGGDFTGSPCPLGPAWSPDIPPCPSLHPGGRAGSAWYGGMSPCPHPCPARGPFCTPSSTPSLSSQRHPRSADGFVRSCPHEASPPIAGSSLCPMSPTPWGTGRDPGAAVVGVTPSLSAAHSAPAPLGFAPASARVSRDLSVFLSRNTGFLVKSCSSVAVTTLLQFPSRDVFLCCDRDAGRQPPTIGVRGRDGKGLLPRRAGTRRCRQRDPAGLWLRHGIGGVPTARAQPWLGSSHPGDSGGGQEPCDMSLKGLSQVSLPSRATTER